MTSSTVSNRPPLSPKPVSPPYLSFAQPPHFLTSPPSDTPNERLCEISLQLADESLAARSQAMAEELQRQAHEIAARDTDLKARQAAFEKETAAHAATTKALQDRQLALDEEVARRVAQAQGPVFSPPAASSPIRPDPNADAFGDHVATFEGGATTPPPKKPHGVDPLASLTSALAGVLQNQNAANIQLASLISESSSTKRKAATANPAPAKRIHLEAGADDAESVWHHEARNLRPFRGSEWQDRFTHLGQHATPIREDLAWDPVGVIEVAPATIRKLHDRGQELQIKMFSPLNVDVACRSGRFHMSEDGESVSIKALDFKPILHTWQLVEALTTYTLCLHRVWPEDWTGLALTKVLNHYRWLAPSGRSRAEQVKILSTFINTVFTQNASRGRACKAPYTLKEIEEVMDKTVWCKGIDKAACLGASDPFASSNSRAPAGPPALHYYGPTHHNPRDATATLGPNPIPRNTRGGNRGRHTPQGNNGNRGGSGGNYGGAAHRPPGRSGHSTNIFRMTLAQKYAAACASFNSPTGCSSPNCNLQHRCTRLLDARNMCLKADHGSIDHV